MNPTLTASNPKLVVGDELVFQLTVSDNPQMGLPSRGDTDRVTITIVNTLSTDDFNTKAITVFFTSSRNLRITGLENEKADVQLFDILGSLILETSVSSGEVKLSGGIKAGIYIVRINTLKGSLSKKIILR